jgi:hypothetical protein
VRSSARAGWAKCYAAGNGNDDFALIFQDRKGVVPNQVPLRGFAYSPAVSPDGKRVAFQGPPDDIWVMQLDSKAMTQLTFDPGEHETPVWSPDGRRVAYASSRKGYARAVFARAADGNGPEERFFVTDAHVHLSAWSPDGRSILFEQGETATGWDLGSTGSASRNRRGCCRVPQTRCKLVYEWHCASAVSPGRQLPLVCDERWGACVHEKPAGDRPY